MIYTDVFILYEYHENVEFWVWWWSGGVKDIAVAGWSSFKVRHTASFCLILIVI